MHKILISDEKTETLQNTTVCWTFFHDIYDRITYFNLNQERALARAEPETCINIVRCKIEF